MAVHDVIPKKVPIQLDKKRYLVYDLNALSALEETYGAVDQAFAEVEKGSDMPNSRLTSSERLFGSRRTC